MSQSSCRPSSCSYSCVQCTGVPLCINSNLKMAVHKVRHATFGQFLPPPSVTLPGTPAPRKYVTHLGRPSTKNPNKSPLYKFCLNCSWGFLSEGFVRGSFLWKVLSGVVFVPSQSVRIHLL